jgi:acyl dehydratase
VTPGPTLTAAELSVGHRVPPLERTLTVVTLAAYAGATWDWHRLHYDPEYARARQLPGPVVDGQMFGALLAEALLDWLGPRAFIQKLGFRMKGMVFAGQTVRCDGEVTAIHAAGDHDVLGVAQRITVDGRLAAEGTAEIRLPRSA